MKEKSNGNKKEI